MTKPIAIIAGEPNSISSEIIFKSWNLKNKFLHRPFFVIGSITLLRKQKKKLGIKIKIKEIKKNFKIKDLKGSELPVYNVTYDQKKTFQQISNESNKYIFACFDKTLDLIKKKRILGFVNCPVSKESLFKKKHQGITEFLSKKNNNQNNEVMLIYNKNLSVSPITTHIPLSKVTTKVTESKIIKNVKTINTFYKKNFKIKPHIAILGLNPHNFLPKSKYNKKDPIIRAIKKLISLKIHITGPVAPDSSFVNFKKNKINVIVGMYHDQVLTPFKALYKFNAINVTLGLPYLRTSPDHGVAQNITGKKVANASSLIESIKFFNYII